MRQQLHEVGDEWRKEAVKWIQEDLGKKGVIATGALISSVISGIKKTDGGFVVQIYTRHYGGILNSLAFRKKLGKLSKIKSQPTKYRTLSRARVGGAKALFAKLLEYYDFEVDGVISVNLGTV